MNAVNTANLVGITGLARRLVQDGALDEAAARDAMAKRLQPGSHCQSGLLRTRSSVLRNWLPLTQSSSACH